MAEGGGSRRTVPRALTPSGPTVRRAAFPRIGSQAFPTRDTLSPSPEQRRAQGAAQGMSGAATGVALQAIDELNEAQAAEKAVGLTELIGKKMIDLRQLKGTDVSPKKLAETTAKFEDEIEEARGKAMADLTSDKQREILLQKIDRSILQAKQAGRIHFAKESERYKDAQTKDDLARVARQAILSGKSSLDPKEIGAGRAASVDEAEQVATKFAARKKLSPAETKSLVLEARTQTHDAVIDDMVKLKSGFQAKQYYTKIEGDLDPKQRGRIFAKVKRSYIGSAARDISEKVRALFKGDDVDVTTKTLEWKREKAMEIAKKEYGGDSDILEKSLQLVNHDHSISERDHAKIQDELFESSALSIQDPKERLKSSWEDYMEGQKADVLDDKQKRKLAILYEGRKARELSRYSQGLLIRSRKQKLANQQKEAQFNAVPFHKRFEYLYQTLLRKKGDLDVMRDFLSNDKGKGKQYLSSWIHSLTPNGLPKSYTKSDFVDSFVHYLAMKPEFRDTIGENIASKQSTSLRTSLIQGTRAVADNFTAGMEAPVKREFMSQYNGIVAQTVSEYMGAIKDPNRKPETIQFYQRQIQSQMAKLTSVFEENSKEDVDRYVKHLPKDAQFMGKKMTAPRLSFMKKVNPGYRLGNRSVNNTNSTHEALYGVIESSIKSASPMLHSTLVANGIDLKQSDGVNTLLHQYIQRGMQPEHLTLKNPIFRAILRAMQEKYIGRE